MLMLLGPENPRRTDPCTLWAPLDPVAEWWLGTAKKVQASTEQDCPGCWPNGYNQSQKLTAGTPSSELTSSLMKSQLGGRWTTHLWCSSGHAPRMPFLLIANHMTNGLAWNRQVIQNCRVKKFQAITQHSLVIRERRMKTELEKHNLRNKLGRPGLQQRLN